MHMEAFEVAAIVAAYIVQSFNGQGLVLVHIYIYIYIYIHTKIRTFVLFDLFCYVKDDKLLLYFYK